MARPQRLDEDALAAALATVPGWRREGNAIRRHFRFATFRDAFAFMTAVAAEAERLDHHPDWSNSYRDVDVALSTHDAGGLTVLDFALARAIDAAAGTA
jgi:4a-hydroxytetrahydrobiopterin dehydratase